MRPRWLDSVHRVWMLYHLADPDFAFLYEPPPAGEWVALDCETTGLDVNRGYAVQALAGPVLTGAAAAPALPL